MSVIECKSEYNFNKIIEHCLNTCTLESLLLSSFLLIHDIILNEADLFLIGDRELNAPGSTLWVVCVCVCV